MSKKEVPASKEVQVPAREHEAPDVAMVRKEVLLFLDQKSEKSGKKVDESVYSAQEVPIYAELEFTPQVKERFVQDFFPPEVVQELVRMPENIKREALRELVEAGMAFYTRKQEIKTEAAGERENFFKRGLKKVGKFLDLDSPSKVAAFAAQAAIEIVPFVGATQAVIGYRLKDFEWKKTTVLGTEIELPMPVFEKLNVTDRIIYLAGEFCLSGEAVRAGKQLISKIATEGFKKVAKELGLQMGKRAAQDLAKRAINGAEKFTEENIGANAAGIARGVLDKYARQKLGSSAS